MSSKSVLKYDRLSKELEQQIQYDRSHNKTPKVCFPEHKAQRRDMSKDAANLWRPTFVRDCEKILHSNFYNRYADKTQVLSFYKNDDITRRAQHVQLVSRIARNIGRMLGLSLDLIEAIALGHDIGHTPFGHAGEKILCQLYHEKTGRYFQHNVHSVRVLDKLAPYNLTLQTLNGILSHNGEMELCRYTPQPMESFDEFDRAVENCYQDISYNKKMVPSTLEGCVVRICDIIAYLGKDRQDAIRTKRIDSNLHFPQGPIGTTNAEIINNLTVNIIENSYGKPYIEMDAEYFEALSAAKKSNYELIYLRDDNEYSDTVAPMMQKMYDLLRVHLQEGKTTSPIFTHHIEQIESVIYRKTPYRDENVDEIVTDYIASMTDDYFLDLFAYLFPKSNLKIEFKGYF